MPSDGAESEETPKEVTEPNVQTPGPQVPPLWKSQGANPEAVGEHRASAAEERNTEVKQMVDDSLVE